MSENAALPSPTTARFRPLRAGILSLWQFEDQELWFEQGRLILRGENGAGKSKALELLLPFLLDADLSPQRLDPFASTARSMSWNLLEESFESRLGYVWLELGRRVKSAGEMKELFLTLGCGLRASRRNQQVDSWYFLTSQRIGHDLTLLEGRTPRTREQLRTALGAGGQLFERGKDYRSELDARLFRLGEDSFAALRQLLLALRRPHLSEKLDPESLSDLLSESLPALDGDLVSSVSESFERLEKDRKELEAVAARMASVGEFLEIYRDHAKGVTRARAAQVRSADHRVHDTAAQLRTTESEQHEARATHAQCFADERQTETQLLNCQGALAALEQSDAMRQAAALDGKRQHAAELRRIAERDKSDQQREHDAASSREREKDRAVREAEERRLESERGAETARAEARRVGLEAAHTAAAEVLAGEALVSGEGAAQEGDPEAKVRTARATLGAALRQRREGIAELLTRRQDRDQARFRFDAAEDRRREAGARAEAARERRQKAEGREEHQREELVAALEIWRGELVELPGDEQSFLPVLALVEAPEVGDLAAAVLALATLPRERLLTERATLTRENERLAAERAEVAASRAAVAAAREVPPQAPRTREADRTGRPGAPFYQLCEPAPGLSAAEVAGLEATLEATGLLDAWVWPNGEFVDPETLDTRLLPSPRPGPGTLAEFLLPAPGFGVGGEEIAALLASIDLAGEGPENSGERRQWVGVDGRFQLGPLAGAWAKPRVEFLGASAREVARQRRLAELDMELERLEGEAERLAARLAELCQRLSRLEAEIAALPDSAELRRAVGESLAARSDLDRRFAELTEAEQQVAALRQTYEQAEARLARRARELQLAAWLDDLEAYRETLRSYENAAEAWLRGHREAWWAGRRAAEAEFRFEEAARRREEARQRAELANEASRRAWAEYETLESTVGAEVKDVLARKEREVARRTSLDERRKLLRREAQEAGEKLARLSERYALKKAELDDRHLERDKAVFGLQRLGSMELLPLVTERLPTEPPKDWTLTRSLELARALEQELSHVDLGDNARNRRAEQLHAGYNQLLSDLGQEFQPNLLTEDDVWIVRMMRDQNPLDPRQLLALLADEKAQRANLLAKEEREVLLKFLLGEIGDHLRQRLRQARELVEGMNRELKDCATASGMTLKLDWRPEDSHDAAPSREIVPLLARGAEMLSEAERAQLQSFFHTRIVAAREQWQAVPWREHLLKTLDYRRWHSFRLKRKEPGKNDWSELTKKGHAASSGGEKAVALHLPLFAAAAAHYQSADPASPRLILLDEAFVGIDDGMKGRLMALLVRFDLDFLMTSHNEWGCYQELPGVATYHLMRDPRERGVLATRFVWNGERLSEDHSANDAESP